MSNIYSEFENALLDENKKLRAELEEAKAKFEKLQQTKRPFTDALAQKVIDGQVKELDRLRAELTALRAAPRSEGTVITQHFCPECPEEKARGIHMMPFEQLADTLVCSNCGRKYRSVLVSDLPCLESDKREREQLKALLFPEGLTYEPDLFLAVSTHLRLMREKIVKLESLAPRSETEGREPVWIVNDSGELGVKLGERLFFLYKGDNIEYKDGRHDDGTPMLYRRVGKREFGETQWPDRWLREGRREDRYTEECRAGINSLPDVSHEYEWREFPALAHDEKGAGE